jgi:putative ABC transport system substrate-binding protein
MLLLLIKLGQARLPEGHVALATPSAQANYKISKDIPVVFGAITDPVAAGLVTSNDVPSGNATGTTDVGPYLKQFEIIREIQKNAKRVGIIRNPGESNSVASMVIIDKAIEKYRFTKVEVAVSTTNEVVAAANSLVNRCDLFYMPADNTVLSALDAIVKVANREKIPLYVGDQGSVKMGGALTLGIDYYDLGVVTGEIIVRIFKGESPGKIPVQGCKNNDIFINQQSIKAQGINIPEKYLEKAKIL